MTFSLLRERSPRWKYLISLIVLSLLAIAAWYFTRPAPLSVQLAEQQLKTVTSRIDEVCTIAEQSSKAAERARQLRERGFISADSLERADAAAKARQASCATARSEIAQSHSRVDVARAGLQGRMLAAPLSGRGADI